MRAAITTSRMRWWLVVCAAVGSVGVDAQSVPSGTVSALAQRSRDEARLRILNDELKAEEAAALQATQRESERRQAGDHVGRSEAQSAIDGHTQNIAALRREIERATRTPVGARDPLLSGAQVVRTRPAARGRAPQPAGALDAGASEAASRPWDIYARGANGVPVADRAPPVEADAPPAGWDLYARSAPARAKPGDATRAVAQPVSAGPPG